MKKKLPSVKHVETLSLSAMRGLVADLVEISHEYEAEFEKLRLVIEQQRLEHEQLALKYERSQLESDMLRFEDQQLRDEIARLKNLPLRPPFKSSGMEKAIDPKSGTNKADKKKPRGAKRDQDKVTREEIVRADVPQGSRFKGYDADFTKLGQRFQKVADTRFAKSRTTDGIEFRLPCCC